MSAPTPFSQLTDAAIELIEAGRCLRHHLAARIFMRDADAAARDAIKRFDALTGHATAFDNLHAAAPGIGVKPK